MTHNAVFHGQTYPEGSNEGYGGSLVKLAHEKYFTRWLYDSMYF